MIYEYECERCSHIFSLRLPMSKCDLHQECPRCTGRSKRIPSVTAYRRDHTIL